MTFAMENSENGFCHRVIGGTVWKLWRGIPLGLRLYKHSCCYVCFNTYFQSHILIWFLHCTFLQNHPEGESFAWKFECSPGYFLHIIYLTSNQDYEHRSHMLDPCWKHGGQSDGALSIKNRGGYTALYQLEPHQSGNGEVNVSSSASSSSQFYLKHLIGSFYLDWNMSVFNKFMDNVYY